MKKVILFVIISLLLNSCSIDWNWEKDKKIAELEKQLENDIYIKKEKCINSNKDRLYINDIIPEQYSGNFFYSTVLNSCLFTYEWYDKNLIIDVLNSKTILTTTNKKEFENKINELK